jgi:hypothetical protein
MGNLCTSWLVVWSQVTIKILFVWRPMSSCVKSLRSKSRNLGFNYSYACLKMRALFQTHCFILTCFCFCEPWGLVDGFFPFSLGSHMCWRSLKWYPKAIFRFHGHILPKNNTLTPFQLFPPSFKKSPFLL